jgi:glycosyltransferase involved in cell wall biosynthesis
MDNEALDRLRRRLAVGIGVAAAPALPPLSGQMDEVAPGFIRGWAWHGEAPVRLRILDNGVLIGMIVAEQPRPDLAAAGIGAGQHGFHLEVPGGLAPHIRHVIEVLRNEDGHALHRSPWVVEATQAAVGLVVSAPTEANPQARGRLDSVRRDRVAGWAHHAADALTPVAVQILDNGAPIACVLANRYRADLDEAGIGRGRHGFDIVIPGGLSPLVRHVIQARHERDGSELENSPFVIEAAGRFDRALEQTVADAITAAVPGEQPDILSFLRAQTERLLQQRGDSDGRRDERLAHRQFRRRWGPAADSADAPRDPGLRALVIDGQVPAPGRDAGSQAVLSHIQALQDLGYAISFVAADDLDEAAPVLTGMRVTACSSPFYASVEDVLRRQAGCFDVVYLHRAGVAERYLALARYYNPLARLLYSVADVHWLRLERQARAEDRPELLVESRRLRLIECTAAWSADAVITHSVDEAQLLRHSVPQASVHCVPWGVPVRRPARPLSARSGVAFIGGYAHAPNVDAAIWLVEIIMPLVWEIDRGITCRLVGSAMPDRIRALARPGIDIVGEVADLGASVFDHVRLTVAPLRFGSGVKGKVLESLGAGVPCVMSAIAAEGLALPDGLGALVGTDATDIARLTVLLHTDLNFSAKASRQGRALIRVRHTQGLTAQALLAAIDGRKDAEHQAASR